jgi:hypothetical protein
MEESCTLYPELGPGDGVLNSIRSLPEWDLVAVRIVP